MDQFVVPLAQQVHQAAQTYLAQGTVAQINYAHFQEFLTTGRRDQYEAQYFARRRQMAVLALEAYQAADAATVALLQEVLWATCDEFTWALPAHLPRHNDQFAGDLRGCIELFGAECGQALADIVSHIGAKLDPLIVTRIRDNVQTRLFEPFLAHDWFWEHSHNNWSAVIAGSIGMAALDLLAPDDPQQVAILAKVDQILTEYLTSYSEDGACVEGVGYWVYGFGYYLYFAKRYEAVFDDDRFLTLPKVKAIAAFPAKVQVGAGKFLPFSDYASSIVPVGLSVLCADTYDVAVPLTPQVEDLDGDECYRFAHLATTLAYGRKLPEATSGNSAYFADVQWWLRRLPNGTVFAAKGGRNDESHNHLDVGEWLLGMNGTWLLTDLGAGEYTRQYFTEDTRYDYLPTSAGGHSIPEINHHDQQPGPHGATTIAAPGNQLTLALADLYPAEAGLQTFTRTYLPQVNGVVLKDHYRFKQTTNTVCERLVTLYQPVISEDSVQITHRDVTCIVVAHGAQITVHQLHYLDHHRRSIAVYVVCLTYQAAEALDVTVAATLKTKEE
ncbi:hypothetical protein [Lacticaseibacillus jixiensis]|uniref:hypothetical protein n=1 Tax=Lacticaseibacillus jixiensis TaxID=3231926 RepID=UPI0036F21D82